MKGLYGKYIISKASGKPLEEIRKIVLAVKHTAESGEAYKSILKIVDILNAPEPQPDQYGLIPRTPEAEIVHQEFLKRCESALPDQSSRLLTDEEFAVALEIPPECRKDKTWLRAIQKYYLPVAKAQLAKDDARIEALIEDIFSWIKSKQDTPLGKDAYGYYIWRADLENKIAELKATQ